MTHFQPSQIEQITRSLTGVTQNELMSKHTNFRIGGPARLYVVANDADALIVAVKTAIAANVPWYVFGGGSNLLVSDDGYEGLIIQSALRDVVIKETSIICGSGAIMTLVARKCAQVGLAGFEWAVGVPGTIGGAIYGDAGCYGGETKDVIASVDAYRVSDGQRVTYANAECGFGYRDSRFKHEPHVILGCEIRLAPGDATASVKRMEEIVATRREKQPLEQSSAGCLFKNFEFRDESEIEKLTRETEVPEAMLKNHRISAGWLVDSVGMLEQKIGDIQVSPKHGNFFVNLGNGRAQDVIALSSLVKMKIRDELGVMLENEVQMIGF
jgi:UDP-N-acetylmuramate dehydrogenase